ncbi:MAG: BTAD domain-containing putative transcriptional regulator [Acidimicrobiales bacterium]
MDAPRRGIGGDVGGEVELRLLGPVEAVGRDGPLHLGGPHQRAIVASLALSAGRTVATDELIDGLWGDAAPQHVRKSLSTQIARVRRTLAAIEADVTHTGGGYRLDLPPGVLDLHRFERAEHQASELAAAQLLARATERLRDGLALWHGEPLADLTSFPFARAAATWLLPRRHAAEDRLAELLLASGDPHGAAQLLRRLVDEDPYDERRSAQLVRALSAGGRRREALLAYQRARDQLGEDLGLDPGPELREVERDVLAGERRPPAAVATERALTPFIGRTVELDRLDGAFERASRGALHAVAVLGEPGIGKSRLLDELTVRFEGRGIRVLRGACEPSQTVPLRCLFAALEPWVTDPAGAAVRELDLLGLGAANSSVALVEPTGLDLRRYRVISALSRTLAALASSGPTALVLDDVHWLDPFSTAVLDHLSRESSHLPLLVVAAASTAPATWPAMEEQLVRFGSAIPIERLRMRPLSGPEVAALVRDQVVGVTDVDELAAQIEVASGGNALYATQLASAAAAAGRLPTTVPVGLDAMCRARVAAATPAARQLLDAAAVLGTDVPLGVLPSILDTSRDDVERRVAEVRTAGLLATDDHLDRVRFSHGVVRRVIYADLTPTQRRRLHERSADALDALTPREPGHLAAIAHHLEAARPLVSDARAAQALEAAGRHAAGQGALEVSRRLLEQALQLAAEDQRAGIEIGLGMVAVAEGDLAGVKQIEAGALAARAEGRWDLVADAAVARSQLAASPTPHHALELAADIEEAVAHIDPGDLTRRGLLESWRGYLLVNVDAVRSASALEAAEAARTRGSSPMLEVAIRYTRLRQAEARSDDPHRCEQDALELAGDALRLGDPSLASYGHVAAQAARLRGGRFHACRAAQPEYLARAVEGHQRAIELQLVAVDAALAFATGTVAEIRTSGAVLFDRLVGAAVESAPAVRFVQTLFAEREGGGSERWAQVVRHVATAAPDANAPILAAALLAQGDREGARDLVEPFLAGLARLPRDWAHHTLVALAAEVVTDLELAGPHVPALYDALAPSEGQVVTLTSVVAVLGRVDRYLGRLAHLAGDHDRAIAHLETARRLDDGAGSGLWSGWAARDEALVRRARGAPGDREAAAELLDLAQARAQTHGSARLAAASAT